MWMDHRAKDIHQQLDIPNTSPEMSLFKYKWLEQFKSKEWLSKVDLFELPDFLVYKTTGIKARSFNCLECKWGILIDDTLKQSNLLLPGQAAGIVSKEALEQFGIDLNSKVVVASGIIDAYAGAIGTLGDIYNQMAMICGTSNCYLSVSSSRIKVKNVWGPFDNALFKGSFVTEGGQSCAGQLLDHIVSTHSYYQTLLKTSSNPLDFIENYLLNEESRWETRLFSIKNMHILPDFHGNRSPFSDSDLNGVMVGLQISNSLENLALWYLACLEALCLQAKHIISHIESEKKQKFASVVVSGGMSRNKIFTQLLADVLEVPVLIPENVEYSVLRGCAIYASTAFESMQKSLDGLSSDDLQGILFEQMNSMNRIQYKIEPGVEFRDFHYKKYKVLMKMYSDWYEYKAIME